MLTPAEELGLSGMSLAGRVRRAFYTLDRSELADLFARIREQCVKRHMVYLRDGQVDTVRVLPCPLTMLPDQMGYVHYVSLTIQTALKRLPDLYQQDPAVRAALEVSEAEESWLAECWGPSHQESNPVFGRLDAVVDFSSPMWKDSLRFVEPNMSGIGGLHLVPMCEDIVTDLVFPVLQDHDAGLQLETGHDIRELLMQEIVDHLEAIGRPGRNVCFVEPKFTDSGIDEQEDLTQFYRARHGLNVFHADPTELALNGGQVQYQGVPIDVLYRDYSVTDLLAIERAGADIEPMRVMFRENRVVSSIAAELDQKNQWEVLTDPQLTRQHFSPEERQVFRRHILWTRLLTPRETVLPDGQTGDLLAYSRREQETLVLKPNRSYGGHGVLLGLACTAREWDQALEHALSDGNRWVVQQLATIPVHEFPILDEDGRVHLEPFYVVLGFSPSKYGVAIMARASQKQVVNVAQRGGMCAVALGHPPGRLMGPSS